MSEYINKECAGIAEIVEKIRAGDFGEFNKVSNIAHSWNETRRQTRAIITLRNAAGETKELNLLASLVFEGSTKKLYINIKSYEHSRDSQTTGTRQLDAVLADLCDR